MLRCPITRGSQKVGFQNTLEKYQKNTGNSFPRHKYFLVFFGWFLVGNKKFGNLLFERFSIFFEIISNFVRNFFNRIDCLIFFQKFSQIFPGNAEITPPVYFNFTLKFTHYLFKNFPKFAQKLPNCKTFCSKFFHIFCFKFFQVLSQNLTSA